MVFLRVKLPSKSSNDLLQIADQTVTIQSSFSFLILVQSGDAISRQLPRRRFSLEHGILSEHKRLAFEALLINEVRDELQEL